jgi:hypothetical protein
VLAVLGAVVIVDAAAARPVVHAAETALVVAAITVGAVLGLAAVTAVAWIVMAIRRRQSERSAIAAWTVGAPPPGQAPVIEPSPQVYGPVYEHRESRSQTPGTP